MGGSYPSKPTHTTRTPPHATSTKHSIDRGIPSENLAKNALPKVFTSITIGHLLANPVLILSSETLHQSANEKKPT
jgi:hypothetical protein